MTKIQMIYKWSGGCCWQHTCKECKSLVLTSTMYGARPSGCPKIDAWNRRVEE